MDASARRRTCGCSGRRATVADFFGDPCHGGETAGAPLVGEATGGRPGNPLMVRVALWPPAPGDGAPGPVGRARWKASTCVTLMAFAELACTLIEDEGADPAALDGAALRARLEGVSRDHRDRADLVARAVRAALTVKAIAPPSGGVPTQGVRVPQAPQATQGAHGPQEPQGPRRS